MAAASALMQSDCHASAEKQRLASHECCPAGADHHNCCPDACVSSVAVASSSRAVLWCGRPVAATPVGAAAISSRGESPPIRPPIL